MYEILKKKQNINTMSIVYTIGILIFNWLIVYFYSGHWIIIMLCL